MSGKERSQTRAWTLKAEGLGLRALRCSSLAVWPWPADALSSHKTTAGTERTYPKYLAQHLAQTEGTTHLVIASFLLVIKPNLLICKVACWFMAGPFLCLDKVPSKVRHSSSTLTLSCGLELSGRGLVAELPQEGKCSLWAAACVIIVTAQHRWAPEHPNLTNERWNDGLSTSPDLGTLRSSPLRQKEREIWSQLLCFLHQQRGNLLPSLILPPPTHSNFRRIPHNPLDRQELYYYPHCADEETEAPRG